MKKKRNKVYETEMHRCLIEMVVLDIRLFPNTIYQVCASICAGKGMFSVTVLSYMCMKT